MAKEKHDRDDDEEIEEDLEEETVEEEEDDEDEDSSDAEAAADEDTDDDSDDDASDDDGAEDEGDDDAAEDDEPRFSPGLLQRAKDAGYTEEEIERFPSEGALDAALTASDRKFGEMLRQRSGTPTAPQPGAGDQSPQKKDEAPPPPPPPPAVEDELDSTLETLEKEAEEVGDPALVKAVRAVHKRQATQVQRLETQLAETMRALQLTHLDNEMARLPAEVRKLFTDNSLLEGWDEKTSKGANTKKLLDEISLLAGVYMQRDGRVPPMRELLRRALTNFPKVREAQVEKQKKKVKRVRSQELFKPTHRESQAPTEGKEAARRAVRKWHREHRDELPRSLRR